MIDLHRCEPGIVPLTPHRFVWWTGRVAIGIRYEPRYVETGSHALMWQRALTTEVPRDWHKCPREFRVSRPLWLRWKDWL